MRNALSIWTWQVPAWFASGAPYPYFPVFGANAYHRPFSPQEIPSAPGAATVQNVTNIAHAAIASGPAFSNFAKFND